MAIFQLHDSQPSVLLVTSDDHDYRNVLALARLFAENDVSFHIAALSPDFENIEGQEFSSNIVLLNTLQHQAILPHIIIDCRTTMGNEDVSIPNVTLYNHAIVLFASPCVRSAKLCSFLYNENIGRVNLVSGFFPAMKTLEFAPSSTMSEEACAQVEQLFSAIHYRLERIDDIIGFVAPRIIAMLANEAAFAVIESVSSVQEIDAAMRLGTNYPKGPLEWADEIGIDVVVSILDALFDEYHQERYRACRLLRHYIDIDRTGRFESAGFYTE